MTSQFDACLDSHAFTLKIWWAEKKKVLQEIEPLEVKSAFLPLSKILCDQIFKAEMCKKNSKFNIIATSLQKAYYI